jgi:hypothetical protein
MRMAMNRYVSKGAERASLERDGAFHVVAGLSEHHCQQFEALLSSSPKNQPGVRLSGCVELAQMLDKGSTISNCVTSITGKKLAPVRAILFDKSHDNNWSLGWHQDRTIVVKKRIETPGFGPWTIKAGLQHVAPPFAILEHMVTVRIHLDDVPESNAPLLVALGSHRKGLVVEQGIADVVSRAAVFACTAARGDIWIYSTPILHASERARSTGLRRVLQVDYSDKALPNGLEWLGV